ncbi:beta-N-acetylhexosaminidase [Aestuariibaculum suncheonense]|uniref:beta-N-acetylhexosaminidase n=1 Tax=Aestuariibaculum suncheonense TaxID=1028745 RepID=A0A8J6QDV4_9FLAO|nr:family 20 glycosylhydrolase [Aestuariibaculum suncheonense]MBD0835248.1 family 20 glycosylhydrolase [Aestuariibaculum suncheonense]
MKFLSNVLWIAAAIVLGSCVNDKTYTQPVVQIIPKPNHTQINEGVFVFNENTQFVISSSSQEEIATLLTSQFKHAAGWDLNVSDKSHGKNVVELLIDESIEKEGYQLKIDSNHIEIFASSNAGFLYGIETLRQLLPESIESDNLKPDIDWIVPCLTIEDKPRFQYRGLMLDVSRHFFEIDYLKKTIDRLAMLKMNVLHLHLVDDQGWRIEIKKYPELTNVGAWRVDQEDKHWDGRRATLHGEKGTYGGYYTQEQLQGLVAYAETKNVEIIPEIEMPAHVSSAIASYPELACFNQKIGVPSGGVWPITDIYCAGKDDTFTFLENVLTEVMAIFPSKYIHVGGDEATKTNWAKCSHCKERMNAEGLKSVEELQSYFIKRMERFINANGKRLIGWDEILEGGIAPEATVMSWRGVKGGVEAAEQGHDVIMTPGTHCYFDHYQGPQNEEPLAWGGYTPVSKVYTFDPVVETMTEDEAKHVLGGQANLWSEQIKTESHSEYMIFPRLLALSETLWSPKSTRNWEDFSSRMETMFTRLDYLGINYSKSSYLVMHDAEVDIQSKEVLVSLNNEFTNADIRYKLSEENSDQEFVKYTKPIKLKETKRIQASLFKDDTPVGKMFDTNIEFHKAVGKPITFKKAYHQNYTGEGEFGLVNSLRGTKNFHDGHWQAWLVEDMEAIIDLDESTNVHEVIVGTLENQGPGIYFPTAVIVYLSEDGKSYREVGKVTRAFAKNPKSELKEFKVSFNEQPCRYVKIVAENLKENESGGDTWLFVDEILIK